MLGVKHEETDIDNIPGESMFDQAVRNIQSIKTTINVKEKHHVAGLTTGIDGQEINHRDFSNFQEIVNIAA